MVRRKKPGSIREKRETSNLFTDAYKGTKMTISVINKILNEGRTPTDEQLRFLKKAPSLIKMYTMLEEGKEAEESLPEGALKNWIDKHIVMQNKIIEATGNKRFKLTKEELDNIGDRVGYYRCKLCGNLHIKTRDCMIDEYIKVIKEPNNKSE